MKRLKLITKQQGFTMVEMVIALALTVVLILAIYGAASAMRRSYSQNTLNNYNLLAVKKGLSRIADELRYAKEVKIFPAQDANANENDKATVTPISGPNTEISLLQAAGGGHSLQFVVGGGKPTTIAEPLVESLKFTNTVGSAIVTVTLKVKDPANAKNPALEMSTTVRMLNYGL